MVAPHPRPSALASVPWPTPDGWTCHTSFLPLTLSAIRDRPGLRRLGVSAAAAEVAAADSWLALLGGCSGARRRRFPTELRRLSEAAGEAAGGTWWDGRGSIHRARVTEFEHWVAEALADGDGAEFARACARYDAALAHALVTAPVPT